MYWTFNFIVGLTVVTGQQECKDAVFNDCQFPSVFTAIHADNIHACADVCEVYASIGSCSMYSFEEDEVIGENCKIYDMQTTIPDFQAACNEVGVPVHDECVFYDDECTVTNLCPTCTACGTGTCGGDMQMDCEFQGLIMERHPGIPFDTCQLLCRIERATYIHYYRESKTCFCMASDKRVCKKQVVQHGTDIDGCNPENKVSCQEGWSYYSQTDSCFNIITDNLTWSDAKTRCESLAIGSNLASVTNTQENEYIKELLSSAAGYWMGLNDREEEGTFKWVDGTPLTFTDSNFPSPGNSAEDCVAWWPDANWTWNDVNCSITDHGGKFGMSSVCKMPAM